MHNKAQACRLMPWAWFVAWLLTGVGGMISDIYSSPSKSLIPFIALSAVGWAVGGFITARASKGKSGMAVQLVAWAVAYLIAMPLGRVWMPSRDMGPFVLSVPFVSAGTIGGFASSSRPGAWRLIAGVLVGLVFLLFSPISTYYAGMLLMLFYTSILNPYSGPLGSSTISLFWILPDAMFGLVAGFAARWILGMTADGSADVST
jgi:hypothetical protein